VLSEQHKDWSLVTQILSVMPSVEKMVQSKDFGELKSKLDAAHKLAFPLMQWFALEATFEHPFALSACSQD